MTYVCETCGKSYKSRSGLWKHQKKFGHGRFSGDVNKSDTIMVEDGDSQTANDPTTLSMGSDTFSQSPDGSGSSNPPETPPTTSGDTIFAWADFDFGADESTDTIPTPLKSIVRGVPNEGGKLSKAQRKALEEQNKGILKMGLTTIDVLLTKYGQAVSLDENFKVEHSETDKDLVANAQYRYLEERGLFLTNYLSTGMIAGSLTVWYIGSPLMRIRKNAKRKLIRGRLLSRLPLIGRFFKRKEVEPIAQVVEE